MESYVLQWERPNDYRVFTPTSLTVTDLVTSDGPAILIRLTLDMLKMVNESFPIEKITNGMRQAGPNEFNQVPIKIEEAAVKLNLVIAGQLANILVQKLHLFPEEQRNLIQESFAAAMEKLRGNQRT